MSDMLAREEASGARGSASQEIALGLLSETSPASLGVTPTIPSESKGVRWHTATAVRHACSLKILVTQHSGSTTVLLGATCSYLASGGGGAVADLATTRKVRVAKSGRCRTTLRAHQTSAH